MFKLGDVSFSVRSMALDMLPVLAEKRAGRVHGRRAPHLVITSQLPDTYALIQANVRFEALNGETGPVRKTGRCMVLHEATLTSGFGAELAAQVQERCFYHLETPVERVTGWDTPYPHAQEWDYFPGPARVAAALESVLGR